MPSQRSWVLLHRRLSFTLLCSTVLASPVPEIFLPQADSFSFAELAQKALFRILELGFFRGIAVTLLVLACLVCLLVGSLRYLAYYLNHHDVKLWEVSEELHTFDDEDEKDNDDEARRRRSISDARRPCFQPQTRSRNSRFIVSSPSTPVTKINVRASPTRTAVLISPISPSKPVLLTPTRSPSTPLKSALSPPSSRRSTSARSPIFGPIRTSSGTIRSPSPKAVRWADQLHITFTSTVSMQKKGAEDQQAQPEAEMDITTRTIGSREKRHPSVVDILALESPPSYEMVPSRPVVVAKEAAAKTVVSSMQLEGDTS